MIMQNVVTQTASRQAATYGPALQKMLSAFPDAREKNNGWWAHPDNPTFDFRENENGTVAIHSWTNRTAEEILVLRGLSLKDVSPIGYFKARVRDSLDLLELAQAKRIHWSFLASIGLEDGYRYHGYSYVKVPYYLPDGIQHTKIKVRKAIDGKYKHCWDEGTPGDSIPYGLHKLEMARQAGYLLIGEGESDGWACWVHHIPYLGVPGANMQKSLTGVSLNDIPVIYILAEPDQMKSMLSKGESFYKNIHDKLRSLNYSGEIFCINFKKATGCKDPSELHITLWDNQQIEQFTTIMDQAKEQAIPSNDVTEEEQKKTSLDEVIEHKDTDALYQHIPTLAGMSRTEYLPYEQKIKATFGKSLNMNTFTSALAEQRKTVAAEQASAHKAEMLNVIYEKTDTGMIYGTKSGEPVWISNFTAEIIADITTDDGAEKTRSYEITSALFGRQKLFEVPAKDFAKTDWVDEKLGARARITTGLSMKSHLINAIKYCSQPQERFYYAHTGWRKVDGEMVYLHADGYVSQVSQVNQEQFKDLTHKNKTSESASRANLEDSNNAISQVSQVSQDNTRVKVKLTGSLSHYCLPGECSDLKKAIRSSLRIIDLAPDTITMPLYGSLWRSVLGDVSYGAHLVGQTGWGKTELAALLQQHYGASMHAHKLPGSWESTENSLEMLLFQAKDAMVVIDDFKPKGSKLDQDRLHAKADRVFRQLGNGSARGRLTSNLEQRPERRPRCFILSTGEDVPGGQSLKARCVVVTMEGPITIGETSQRLLEAQRDARSGLYAQAMYSYIAWLSPKIEDIQVKLSELTESERDRLHIDGHGRSGTNTANMILGMKYFLQFACESGAITEQESKTYLARCLDALRQIASDAACENIYDKPSEQWKRLLIAALTSKSAHLVTPKGENPGLEYGWTQSVSEITDRDGNIIDEETVRGGGSQIGWIDGDDIYLLPVAAYKVAQAVGSMIGDHITTLEPTLRKFLVQDKLLASTDLDKARKTIAVRRRIQNLQREVLHIKVGVLFPNDSLPNSSDSPDLPDSTPSEPASEDGLKVSQVSDSECSESSALPDSEPDTGEILNTIPLFPNGNIEDRGGDIELSQRHIGQWVNTPDGLGQITRKDAYGLDIDVMGKIRYYTGDSL